MMKNSSKIRLLIQGAIVTCGGIGFFPKGSGTVASFFACGFWFFVNLFWGPVGVVVGSLMTLILGGLIVPHYEKARGLHDSSEIVIDEWMGMGIAMSLLPPKIEWIAAAFVLFRIFDIWKPIGVKYFDRNYFRGWGVMLDDLVAGIYALGVLEIFALWIRR